jgi:hypothetical protein
MTDISNDHSPGATGDYSATKAPENRKHVTSTEPVSDPRLKPGGAAGVSVEVGMSALHDADVPSAAEGTGVVDQIDVADVPRQEGLDVKHDIKEDEPAG